MGNSNSDTAADKPAEKDRTQCKNGNHIQTKFNCQGANCNIAPYICKGCSYESEKNVGLELCKLCMVTERMDDIDIDELEIDTSVNSHSITMVASVSFDR